MDSQVSRETWGSRATEGSWVCPAREERTVPRVPKDEPDPTESPVPSVQLEKRVNSVCQDYQVTQDGRGPRAPVGFRASQGRMERKAPGELLGNLVREVSEVQQVHVEREERGVLPENQDLRERLAMMALLVHLGRGDLKDLRDPLVSLDQRDHLDPQERMGCPDTLDREEKQVFKERLVHLVPEASSGRRDQLERLDPWVREATLDLRDHQESRVCQELEAKRAPRETQAPRDLPVKTVPQASEVSPESEVFLEPRVLLV